MADPKQEKAESQKSTDELLKERQSDATNDETLKKTEESQRKLNSGKNSRDSTISPDGELDEREEIDNAGPM